MDKQSDKFTVATPLLTLQSGGTNCLYCGCVISSKEKKNNLKVGAFEKLQIVDGIAEKWSRIQPVSSYAKSFDLQPNWNLNILNKS